MRGKQVWLRGAERSCGCENIEEVKNEVGEAIACICKRCQARVWELGYCDGCHQPGRRITRARSKRNGFLRFCNGVCETRFKEERKAALKSAT